MKWLTAGPFRGEAWHRWFAWFPVCTGDCTVWLQFVERRYSGPWYDAEYRA